MGLGRQAAEKLDLPREVVLDLPLISMTGREEMTIENHKGLMEYGEEKIRIATKVGSLCVSGEGLRLKRLSAECIVIGGQLGKLEFLR